MSKPSSSAPFVTGTPTCAHLEFALRLILSTPDSMPTDWHPQATTYDLPRHFSESLFMDAFCKAAQQLHTAQVKDPKVIQTQLSQCGLPYDYARLGQPLSTLYEAYVAHLSGAEKVISFASASKAYLSVIEARTNPKQTVVLYCAGALPLSSAYQQFLSEQQVHIFEHIPANADFESLDTEEQARQKDTLPIIRIYIHNTPFTSSHSKMDPESILDAVTYPCAEGGLLLIKNILSIDPNAIQIIRKRTVSALLPGNCESELRKLLCLPLAKMPFALSESPEQQYTALKTACAEAIHSLYPEVAVEHSAYFCTGLAAEAAVFEAAAQSVAPTGSVSFYYAQNGYGGTGQLISELLPRKSSILPCPLTVIDTHNEGNEQTLIDRFIQRLHQHQGEPVLLFLETPTNPQLQMHDFAQLVQALKAYQNQYGTTVPVIIDTTMAPLYPLFAQAFTQDWPFILVKSGSKYFTKGKATLGIVMVNTHPLSQTIFQQTLHLGTDADAFAKVAQLQILKAGLQDLPERMAAIAQNTHKIAQYIKEQMQQRNLDLTLYEMTPQQITQGLASGILSFYLPSAPVPLSIAEAGVDLVDAFVSFMLKNVPEQVKNRVSYGQSGGAIVNGTPQDYIYIINPEESTQGALSQAVKDAQKKDNVQICRISVPAHCDVPAFTAVLGTFFSQVYDQ